jgi:cytochrome c oxidase subunit 3
MSWFIFSEVMFFGAFFGALFYARILSVPWLGGAGAKFATNEFLWPTFEAM